MTVNGIAIIYAIAIIYIKLFVIVSFAVFVPNMYSIIRIKTFIHHTISFVYKKKSYYF